jgi:hypothetical protein
MESDEIGVLGMEEKKQREKTKKKRQYLKEFVGFVILVSIFEVGTYFFVKLFVENSAGTKTKLNLYSLLRTSHNFHFNFEILI